jgi:hypothetical protein
MNKETYKESPENFKRFLTACRKAVNKVFGFEVETEYDFWSQEISGKTHWSILKDSGALAVNSEEIACDFRFGELVYADLPASAYK